MKKLLLPKLKGTEAQVKWAEQIRDMYIKDANESGIDISSFLENEDDAELFITQRRVVVCDIQVAYASYNQYFKFDLPEIEGSKKEIEWAKYVRKKMIDTIKTSGWHIPSKEEVTWLVSLLKEKTDPDFFIGYEHFYYDPGALIALAYANTKANEIEPLLPIIKDQNVDSSIKMKQRRKDLERALMDSYRFCAKDKIDDIIEKFMEYSYPQTLEELQSSIKNIKL